MPDDDEDNTWECPGGITYGDAMQFGAYMEAVMTRPTDEELAAAVNLLHATRQGADLAKAIDAMALVVDAAIADAAPITPEALEREGWTRDEPRQLGVWSKGDVSVTWVQRGSTDFRVLWDGFDPSYDIVVTTMGELRTLLRILGRVS